MANVGTTTGTPSTNTVYYDALLSTTVNAYRKTMVDNIFKDSAFLAFLRMSDAIRKQDGGERIQVPLMYGVNNTVGTHGGYSTLDTTPQEGITSAFYQWAEIAGTISISRKEQRQNSGEGRLLNLLEAKLKQAEMSMRETMNQQLVQGTVSSATFVQDTAEDGSYGLNPLGYFFHKNKATDPTTIDCGNIPKDTYSWWQHRVGALGASPGSVTGEDFALNATTYAGLKVALRRLYNYAGRGSGGFPNLGVMDQVSFETYENALDQSVRYMNTKMADMG
ncbi:MAG: phage major capsid protein, partial [Planctomycetota bacterium]